MGIKDLNKFLRKECKSAVKQVHLSGLFGKTVVIDISIYMFKFTEDGGLVENIYLMLSVFRHYNITPIFIFDGKSPTEKKELIQQRRNNRLENEKEYEKLKNALNTNKDEEEKQEIKCNMDVLKKKIIHIGKKDFENVKKIIHSFGAVYYEALGEADELCAFLTIKEQAWACLSEDMDMFVYGCTRVIRYLSLLNHTCVLYEQKEILNELRITQKEFTEICVLSGTDYNIHNKTSLSKTLNLFKSYKNKKTTMEFYEWLRENTNYIEDYNLLIGIDKMFNIEVSENLVHFEKISIISGNGQIKMNDMKAILKEDGFVFPIN
jgi:5'-3' exonuclease